MGPIDWDKLRIFRSVAEAENITHASEMLNVSQSALSRQISALEHQLGVALFHRHARGLTLTEQGEILYKSVRNVFHEVEMSIARIQESKESAQGKLVVNTTYGVGGLWLIPMLDEFIEQFPDIDLNLVLSPQGQLDLAMREADISIRLTRPTQVDLIQTKLMSYRHMIYAAPEYIERFGIPDSLESLDSHRIIAYSDHFESEHPYPEMDWLLRLGRGKGDLRQTVLKVNNVNSILEAVEHGIGIASLPEYLVASHKRLIKILPMIEGPKTTVWMVYPEELRHSKRIGVFRDFLRRKLKILFHTGVAHR